MSQTKKPYKIAFFLTALITAAGLYTGIASDEWGWVFYALFTLILGIILLKRSGTKTQTKTANKLLIILAVFGVLAGLLIVAYLSWMDGFTF